MKAGRKNTQVERCVLSCDMDCDIVFRSRLKTELFARSYSCSD